VISFQFDVKVVGVASGQPDYAEIPVPQALAQAAIVLASAA
jgi:hypothetical protein